MIDGRRWCAGLVSGLLLGCSGPGGGQAADEIGQAREAVSVCNESVPANRYIDGFPAYAQCAASQNGAVYSNNGIDTASSSLGSDWVRTQSSGGYQCTELAHRYLYFKWGVTSVPRGNAGTWCDSAPPTGLVQTTVPVHGDILVLAPGSCGADPTAGHVAVVDTVDAAAARLSAVQQNGASRSNYQLSCAHCYLHVVANNGSVSPRDAGGAGAGGALSGTGGASATGGATASSGGVTATGGTPANPNPSTGGSSFVPPLGSGGTSAGAGGNSSAGTTGGSSPLDSGGQAASSADEASASSNGSCSIFRSSASHLPWPTFLALFAALARRRRRA
jgi:surface antigen